MDFDQKLLKKHAEPLDVLDSKFVAQFYMYRDWSLMSKNQNWKSKSMVSKLMTKFEVQNFVHESFINKQEWNESHFKWSLSSARCNCSYDKDNAKELFHSKCGQHEQYLQTEKSTGNLYLWLIEFSSFCKINKCYWNLRFTFQIEENVLFNNKTIQK